MSKKRRKHARAFGTMSTQLWTKTRSEYIWMEG